MGDREKIYIIQSSTANKQTESKDLQFYHIQSINLHPWIIKSYPRFDIGSHSVLALLLKLYWKLNAKI